jgi:hypothetical protein
VLPLPLELELLLDEDGVLVAALPEAALNTVAPRTPPVSSEPAMMAATVPLRPNFIGITSSSVGSSPITPVSGECSKLRPGTWEGPEECLGASEEVPVRRLSKLPEPASG